MRAAAVDEPPAAHGVDEGHALAWQTLHALRPVVVGEVAQAPALEVPERPQERGARVPPVSVEPSCVVEVQVDRGKGELELPGEALRRRVPQPARQEPHHVGVLANQARLRAKSGAALVDQAKRVAVDPILPLGHDVGPVGVWYEGPSAEHLQHVVLRHNRKLPQHLACEGVGCDTPLRHLEVLLPPQQRPRHDDLLHVAEADGGDVVGRAVAAVVLQDRGLDPAAVVLQDLDEVAGLDVLRQVAAMPNGVDDGRSSSFGLHEQGRLV
mmetsp:Transcript_107348/g.334601  ORF Transcript_107348/g.334601 Transcript_107348/m.334601 type:complete len:268 (-) Transcript_107348:260-1063(-)